MIKREKKKEREGGMKNEEGFGKHPLIHSNNMISSEERPSWRSHPMNALWMPYGCPMWSYGACSRGNSELYVFMPCGY
jgi:hypothetical protein